MLNVWPPAWVLSGPLPLPCSLSAPPPRCPLSPGTVWSRASAGARQPAFRDSTCFCPPWPWTVPWRLQGQASGPSSAPPPCPAGLWGHLRAAWALVGCRSSGAVPAPCPAGWRICFPGGCEQSRADHLLDGLPRGECSPLAFPHPLEPSRAAAPAAGLWCESPHMDGDPMWPGAGFAPLCPFPALEGSFGVPLDALPRTSSSPTTPSLATADRGALRVPRRGSAAVPSARTPAPRPRRPVPGRVGSQRQSPWGCVPPQSSGVRSSGDPRRRAAWQGARGLGTAASSRGRAARGRGPPAGVRRGDGGCGTGHLRTLLS